VAAGWTRRWRSVRISLYNKPQVSTEYVSVSYQRRCLCFTSFRQEDTDLISERLSVCRQEAHLSQRDRAMLCVIEYFVKSLKVIENGTFRKLGYGFLFQFLVTVALSCIVSEIKRDIGRKSWFFHIPLHSTPPLGGSLLDRNRHLATAQSALCIASCGKMNSDYMLLCV